MTDTGELVAQEIEVIMDGGAYCTLTPVVLSRGVLHAGGPYRCENVRITGRAMATNTPPNGAFRGFGAPQTEFAAEMQVNRIAEALDASPLDLRRRWVYREGDATPTGQVLRESVGGIEVLEAAAEASAFDRHAGQTRAFREGRSDGARLASGIGLALAWHGAGFTGSGEVKLASVASLELTDDGRIRILTASTEMGQGTKTIFPQLVADTLGVEFGEVEIAPQDTSIVPDSRPDRRLADRHGRRRAAHPRRREAAGAGGGGDRPAVRLGLPRGRTDADRRAVRPLPRRPVRRQDLHRRRLPRLRLGRGVAAVEVDLDTGEVAVRDCVSADDIGHVIHPILAEGQVEGGTLQAIGYATIEEMKLVDGRYLNDRLATYLIPTSLDAPRLRSILVEKPYSGAPHGAKGVGELPMDVGAPAVVAAIHDATGVWIHDLPGHAGADPGRARPVARPRRRRASRSRRPSPRRRRSRTCRAGGDEMPFRAPNGRTRATELAQPMSFAFTSTARRSRSRPPACGACSTCCARTWA